MKKSWYILGVLLGLCTAIVTFILFDMFSSSTQSNTTNETFSQMEDEEKEMDITNNPFGDRKRKLSESDVQHYIHGMSHQKVKAKEKWTHYRMTEERIQFLLHIVENSDFEHKELYLDILKRWEAKDFSQVDEDHNAIWQLQGGTVGRATGILTKEEEEQYLYEFKDVLK